MGKIFENEREIINRCGKLSYRDWSNVSVGLSHLQPLVYVSSNGMGNKIFDVNIVVPNKVVEVKFLDGDKQKAVCQESDTFSLEQAVSICLTKHLLGGTSAYNKAIKNGMKVYEDKLKAERNAKAEEDRITKRRVKKAAYMKRRTEKRREEQIEIQKEAYVRAFEMVKATSK